MSNETASVLDRPLPWGSEEILSLLPHRDPFVWVTRVLELEPGKTIEAQLDVDPELPLFAGHFPQHPVLPGVILMEALAQAACVCILTDEGREPGSLGFFTGIDGAKFRRQVLPGDTVTLRANIVKSSSRMCVAEVTALVEGQVCATATQKYVMARPE